MHARHRWVEANGIRFHLVEQGEGPVVLLLHGFPEFWYSWRFQLPALAAAGYRAVAPDLRGYNLTDKPRGGYRIETLVADVVALIRALGEERAHVVGHDWGGVIAWQTAWREPSAVRTLCAMNAPHPGAYVRYLARHPAQLLKSSYMLFFQAPGVPEALLRRNRAAAIAAALERSAGRPGGFTAADIEAYRAAFLRPGVARAAIDYYRQAVRQGPRALPDAPVLVPTLVVWGDADPILEAGMNDHLGEWVKDITKIELPGCGHWTQQERPDVVSTELTGWLRARESRT
ncbi:MAG TPA: alpha/beta fold hydrolase [Dehalococcoidia bacterium]|nr:alpha/beta fold hydrolase [Dehalococcoidia bacterium]